MNSESLTTFVILAEMRNFSKAAEILFISQSTVTKRIAELEKELNMKLFSRDNKHVFLTEQGSIFLNYAKRILELEDASIKEIHSSIKYSNNLRVGATNSLYECHLFEKIQRFYLDPNNSVKIIISHSNELLTGLQDGVLDVVFTFSPLNKAGYECIPYQKDQLVLVTNYNNLRYEHGIKKAELIDIDYLICDFALQEDGQFIRELFPLYHQFKFEIDNSTKLIPYIKTGNAYSFIPKKMIEDYLNERIFRIIPLIDFKTPIIQSYCIGNITSKAIWSKIF